MMARAQQMQRTHWLASALQIIVIKFTMTEMVGKPRNQIKVPRLHAYSATTVQEE